MNELAELKIILSDLRMQYRSVSKQLSRCPDGHLMIVREGLYYKYYQTNHAGGRRERRGIGKDRMLISRLAHKSYLEEKRRRLEENIRILENAADHSCSLDDHEILQQLPRHFEQLQSVRILRGRDDGPDWPHPSRHPAVCPQRPRLDIGPMRPEEWASMPYAENTQFLENKIYLTSRGIACRSKSEIGVLDNYDRLQIPFHYDETFLIDGHRLSPDVVGVRSDGMLIYHEHCGRFEEGYKQRMAWKLSLYESVGICPGKNLILSFDHEDGSMNLALIREQIRDAYGL